MNIKFVLSQVKRLPHTKFKSYFFIKVKKTITLQLILRNKTNLLTQILLYIKDICNGSTLCELLFNRITPPEKQN